MKNHYLNLIEKELDRLWVGSQNVLVIAQGKDKFILTDGNNSLHAKGHQVYKLTKRLHDKAGVVKFWKAMSPLNPTIKYQKPYEKPEFNKSVAGGR